MVRLSAFRVASDALYVAAFITVPSNSFISMSTRLSCRFFMRSTSIAAGFEAGSAGLHVNPVARLQLDPRPQHVSPS
jgi:hypothetical protein